SLPTSSAEIESVKLTDSRFASKASSRLPLKPVTITSSSGASPSCEFCAYAPAPTHTPSSPMLPLATSRLVLMIVSPRQLQMDKRLLSQPGMNEPHSESAPRTQGLAMGREEGRGAAKEGWPRCATWAKRFPSTWKPPDSRPRAACYFWSDQMILM